MQFVCIYTPLRLCGSTKQTSLDPMACRGGLNPRDMDEYTRFGGYTAQELQVQGSDVNLRLVVLSFLSLCPTGLL